MLMLDINAWGMQPYQIEQITFHCNIFSPVSPGLTFLLCDSAEQKIPLMPIFNADAGRVTFMQQKDQTLTQNIEQEKNLELC